MIAMSGLDYTTAGLDIREKFSIMESQIGILNRKMKNENDISGCMLISTCNRTELYVTTNHPACAPDAILQTALDLNGYSDYFITRRGDEAVRHLMETAAGLKSQIFGEDQIITQVKQALTFAREAATTDAILETLTRIAITAAKRIKTRVKLSPHHASAAYQGVKIMEGFFDTLLDVPVLVIGNGEMGRIAADCLVAGGAKVTVTIRTYKNKPVIVPGGCQVIPYNERYKRLGEFKAVVSATKSPHFTITQEQMGEVKQCPLLFLDLAVPRDIDPAILNLGTALYNIDDLMERREYTGLSEAEAIIDEFSRKFYDWLDYRKEECKAAERGDVS